MRNRGTRFWQSAREFPALVTLGEKAPSWGLSRWGGAGLRFVPPDEEGFALRGDRRRLVYRGRRRSHRFTILDHQHFEYDIILNREPESNVIALRMEGAENFDFFRQPDFVRDPFLQGSYAVYKKETLVGEGTGKLCHVHRPEIMDSRGRRCWGGLSVAGNELRIAIPEAWLGEAAYPVVVDPTVGTSTVGSQTHWDNAENESHDQFFVAVGLCANRFLVPETLSGTAAAYVYAYASDYDGRCKPVLYSDNNNVPLARRSKEEGSFDIAVGSGKPAGWRPAFFKANAGIASGAYVWLGLFCDWFAPRFDYGAKCYWDFWDGAGNDVPDVYPLIDADRYYNFKLSLYFTYTSAQSYTRTLTQGTSLSDDRKLIGSYKRSATQTALGTGAVKGLAGFCRGIAQTVRNTMGLHRFPALLRKLAQGAGAGDAPGRFLSIVWKAAQTAGAGSGAQRTTQAKREVADTGRAGTAVGRKQDFWRGIAHGGNAEAAAAEKAEYAKKFQETAGSAAGAGAVRELALKLAEAVAALYAAQTGAGFYRGIDNGVSVGSVMGGMALFFRVLFGSAGSWDSRGSFIGRMRIVQDVGASGDATGYAAEYLRGLFVEAGNSAGTIHKADYHRKQQDTAHSEAVPLRQLFVFIRLLTGAYIRDYIIGRFLKSKEEAVVKSPVCREIVLDSTLH
jgi:hypothetical protein